MKIRDMELKKFEVELEGWLVEEIEQFLPAKTFINMAIIGMLTDMKRVRRDLEKKEREGKQNG